MFPDFGGPRPKRFLLPPRGALKFLIMKLIEEKPKTGSEIMDEIEDKSLGYWRPSPGSVYPMLSYLEDKGYIHSKEEGTTKRYFLAPKGKEFLESGKKTFESEPMLRGRAHLFLPPWLDLGMSQDPLLKAFRRQSVQLFRLRHLARAGEAPKELEDRATEIIESASKELEALLSKHKGERERVK
jgi:DNA-binding PadR family transcriptional regulator